MWALGVVLFTMLYGQFPFYDSIPQELFRKIKAAEYSIPEWVLSPGNSNLGLKKKTQKKLPLSGFCCVTFGAPCMANNVFLMCFASPPTSQRRSCVWEHGVPHSKASGVGPSAKAHRWRSAGVSQRHHCLLASAPSAGSLWYYTASPSLLTITRVVLSRSQAVCFLFEWPPASGARHWWSGQSSWTRGKIYLVNIMEVI